jgi:hypothetical protein
LMIILPRRRFMFGLVAALAAPAIVRFESIMPVRAIVQPFSGPVLEVIGTDGEVEHLNNVHPGNVSKLLDAQLIYVH